MFSALRSVIVVVTSLWLGSLFCIGFVLPPYLFTLAKQQHPVVTNSRAAADLIGPLLNGADVASLAVGAAVLLGLLALRRGGQTTLGGRVYLAEIAALVAIIAAAVNYFAVNPKVVGVRSQLTEKFGSMSQADKNDPLYLQFDSLHNASTAVFIVGFVAALVCLICMTYSRTDRAEARSRVA